MNRNILLLAVSAALICGSLFAKEGQVEKRPKDFVDVAMVVPGAIYDIRYFGEDNFTGARVDGYEAPKCILTKKAASALADVAAEMKRFGLKLRIFDCYRPQMAVDRFIRWAEDPKDTKTKAKYYPNVDKRDLFEDGYIAERSGHTRGSTLDLTIDGLDMGTGFDFFGERANTEYAKIPKHARANRLLLKTLMKKAGFEGYDKEWWHFKLQKETYPDKYFNFPVK